MQRWCIAQGKSLPSDAAEPLACPPHPAAAAACTLYSPSVAGAPASQGAGMHRGLVQQAGVWGRGRSRGRQQASIAHRTGPTYSGINPTASTISAHLSCVCAGRGRGRGKVGLDAAGAATRTGRRRKQGPTHWVFSSGGRVPLTHLPAQLAAPPSMDRAPTAGKRQEQAQHAHGRGLLAG